VSDQEEDFAAMFEASVKARQFERGQAVEGTIVAIGPKVGFVNIGGKGEAEIDVAELKDADGDIEVSVGDRISAIVLSTSGGIVLSRKGVRNAATQRQLQDAYESGMAVEGKVVEVNKGGYEIRIGRERAFCPLSQIDIVRTADPAVHVGHTYAFRIIEYKNDGKDIVVSRRKQLEVEQRANAAEVRKSIVEGAILSGRVVSVQDFGAFVELGGGVQGLLHVSEMSWTRVASANEVVAPGDQITVKVLRVDEASGKISLGLKQLLNDPWATVGVKYTTGSVHHVRVSRVAAFGAFVELEPGIEALMPAAESGLDRGADVKRSIPIGSEFDATQREQAEVREYTAKADATAPASIGSMADKLRDALKGR
jgi:small subunit ribosomal protein S1